MQLLPCSLSQTVATADLKATAGKLTKSAGTWATHNSAGEMRDIVLAVHVGEALQSIPLLTLLCSSV
jgi:hypothetical protein